MAAVEIVSPANKDRAETRRAFVAKCAALLQQSVCVSIVDLITTRNFNLYADLLALIGDTPRLETWAYPLALGKPLPKLPIWLTEEQAIDLDLEASYEETCRVLRIARCSAMSNLDTGSSPETIPSVIPSFRAFAR